MVNIDIKLNLTRVNKHSSFDLIFKIKDKTTLILSCFSPTKASLSTSFLALLGLNRFKLVQGDFIEDENTWDSVAFEAKTTEFQSVWLMVTVCFSFRLKLISGWSWKGKCNFNKTQSLIRLVHVSFKLTLFLTVVTVSINFSLQCAITARNITHITK